MYQLSDKALRIEAAKGVLIVLDSANKPHRINEASMADFEQFYALWSVAVQMASDESFMNAWCFVDGFKQTMIEAMQWLGFDNPEAFSPSQLEALLFNYGEGLDAVGGILFQFHQTYPKLTQKAMKTNPVTTSGNLHRKPMISISLESMPINHWMAIARAKLGHSLKSCGTWLLTASRKLQQTPNEEKN